MDNSNKELISVIVTSYNHAEYLDERMESLLQQTYKNLEIIVVDDCSSDRSVEVLTKYDCHNHVKIVALEKNGGYANATNLGVSLSNGGYIMFAECDDFNESTHIEVLYDKMCGSQNIGVAFSKSNMIDSNGNTFGDDFCFREKSFKHLCLKDTVIPQRDIQRFFLISCVIPNMSAALLRKDLFQRVGGLSPEYKACADWDFWCRVSALCDFYYVASPLNNFRTHQTSVRSTSGIQLPVTEIFALLYSAFRKVPSDLCYKIKFSLNIGIIWTSYISANPFNWLLSFPKIWLRSLKYDKFCVLYLVYGILYKIYSVLLRAAINSKLSRA